MTNPPIPPPDARDYAPFYAGYVRTVVDSDLRTLLPEQPAQLRNLCGALTDEQARYRYTPGKWSIKEVLGHISDAERVFAYRLLRISRGDQTPLPGFDEKTYVAHAVADERSVEDLLGEFEAARAATLSLVDTLDERHYDLRGVASGAEVSVAAQLHILAGHVAHHLNILRERYGL